MNKDELKGFVNKILAKKGHPPVTKFASEFADGIVYEKLFNSLFDEDINCRLKKSELVEDRLINWNKINTIICFNFMQQRFYLVQHTMKALAKGTSTDPIFKLLKVTIDTHQQMFAQALLNSEAIEDIADKVQTSKQLFASESEKLNITRKGELTNDMFDPECLNSLDMPEPSSLPSPNKRSSAFEFLLEEQKQPAEPLVQNDHSNNYIEYSRDNFRQYVNDLSCGDVQLEEDNKQIMEH